MNTKQIIGGVLILIAVAIFGASVNWSVIIPDVPIVDVVPDPAPIVGDGLHVLIIEETADRHKLPSGQQDIIGSVRLRKWLTDHNAEFRIEDQDDPLTFAAEKWRNAMQLPRESVPWIHASNGKTGFSGPLPNSVDELMDKLEALTDG